jgi:hypothetical protein
MTMLDLIALESAMSIYDFGRCELVFEIQPEKSLTIHQRVHLLARVGSLAGFVDLKSDVARCPKHVLSDLGPEILELLCG